MNGSPGRALCMTEGETPMLQDVHLPATESIIAQDEKKLEHLNLISDWFLFDILQNIFVDSFLIESFSALALTPHWFISSFHCIILSREKIKLFRQANRVKILKLTNVVKKDVTGSARKERE